VARAPKAPGSKVEFAKNQPNPITLAINEVAVYWANLSEGSYKQGSVRMLPKDASQSSVAISVAEDQWSPSGITADETAVYWGVLGHDVGDKAPGTGSIMKMPIDAEGKPLPNTAPIVLAGGQNSPTALRVYKHILYWTTGASGGQVFRMVQ
jgi:hypothetical protein